LALFVKKGMLVPEKCFVWALEKKPKNNRSSGRKGGGLAEKMRKECSRTSAIKDQRRGRGRGGGPRGKVSKPQKSEGGGQGVAGTITRKVSVYSGAKKTEVN